MLFLFAPYHQCPITIELVIVIVILGILSVVAAPAYVNLRSQALETGLKASLSTIRSSVSLQHSHSLAMGSDVYPVLDGTIFEEGIVPADPYSNSVAVVTSNVSPLKGSRGGITVGGWIYNQDTGEARANHEDYDEY
jgi:MSHA pilin protein MshA